MLAPDATRPRGALVLVADDDRSFLELVSHWLRDAGCEVLTAESGHETIRVAEERRPDLVLLDIVLPGLNGFQVCEELLVAHVRRALLHAKG